MPFIDHIRLSNGERFAITLEGIKPSAKAKMQFLGTQIEIEKGEEIFFDDDLNLLKESEISPKTNITYIFKVEEIGDKYIRLKEMDKEEEIEINKENPYSICFDGKIRELHLEQIINEVTLNVLLFPGEYASLRDKPYYEEMLEELRLDKKANRSRAKNKIFEF